MPLSPDAPSTASAPHDQLVRTLGEACVIGFSHRKRGLLRRFLPPGVVLRDGIDPSKVPAGATVLTWGSTPLPGLHEDVRVVRVEDGFLRSVGLGAAFAAPQSWVFDARGMHYDAATPSDLEVLLGASHFDAGLIERAARLRERIVAAGMTKYNLGGTTWRRPLGASTVCLVLGQVESDASLAHGSPQIRRNVDLLRAVRALRPGAWLVYRPHPDVVARLRDLGDGEADAAGIADEVQPHADLLSLIEGADEVHVLTSLGGFEALLRGRQVVTHGIPFYAGWGLTEDRIATPRRSRRRTLDELVAAALILYPSYVRADTDGPATPEAVIDDLEAARERGSAETVGRRLGTWAGRMRQRLGAATSV